ncbi:MAG: complex I NDUFA9 subunit family protein [Geopsychrobacter sp.]|nr:complex I NDUFA9 subunit family protein [Geopsychrobacter sp.]
MHIFVTGGSGFVGRTLCRKLIDRGHRLSCLIRTGSEPRLPESSQIKSITTDLFDSALLAPLIKDCDAVIHLVGIIREFTSRQISFKRLHLDATRSILAATQQAGVKRFLHMSANGARNHAVSAYHQTKWLAEEEVRKSDLDWTIFRPSLIYGAEDQFISMLCWLIKRLPVVPVMGNGEYCLQPVPVAQIALGFANALDSSVSLGKTYHCGGADCLSYNRLLDEVGLALRKPKVIKLSQPLALMRPLVHLLQRLPPFPMTSDQLQMLIEGNCCETEPWLSDLGLDPVPLRSGLTYLKNP